MFGFFILLYYFQYVHYLTFYVAANQIMKLSFINLNNIKHFLLTCYLLGFFKYLNELWYYVHFQAYFSYIIFIVLDGG